jgi:hypothetical protein
MDRVYAVLRSAGRRFRRAMVHSKEIGKRFCLKQCIKEHPLGMAFIAGTVFAISGCIILPPQGHIIPMGPEMRNAFDLLSTTRTGKALISKAQKSTRGSPIFLTLGTTKSNDLVDGRGATVVGVTRAYFKIIANRYFPDGVFIYSNRDMTDVHADLIALNIAFELENVIYAMQYPCIDKGDDSPMAWSTLERVAKELGVGREM